MIHKGPMWVFARRTGAMRGGDMIAGAACVVAIAAALAFLGHYPRTFVIENLGGGAAAITNGMDKNPPSTIANNSSFANPAATLNPIDISNYNKKLLAIAHLPPLPPATSTISSTSSIKTPIISESTVQFPAYPAAPGRAALAKLWPAKAPYPEAGAILPFNRIVAYYGNLYSKQMGVLGEYPSDQMLQMLTDQTAKWNAADTSTPAIPALDYIAVTAQASAGSDGKYRARMPDDQVEKVLQLAAQVNGLVILDVQVGLSNVETEVPLLEQYLKLPHVELALDPEFDMHNGKRPGTVIGTMDASDINWAARYLANLVEQNHLPPKILVIHRFTNDMVTNTAEITPLPQVQIVMDMDGFGSPAKKIGTYYQTIEPYPVQFTGFKLFYKNDAHASSSHVMIPQEVLRLSPQPSFIQYQ